MLHVLAACSCCMSVLLFHAVSTPRVQAVYLCYLSMQHVHAACPCCMPGAAFPFCMSWLHCLTAWSGCNFRLHSHAACERCISAHVQCCRFRMSMLHARAASPWCISMQQKFEAKRGKIFSSFISLRRCLLLLTARLIGLFADDVAEYVVE
jgi:hypothetical protein